MTTTEMTTVPAVARGRALTVALAGAVVTHLLVLPPVALAVIPAVLAVVLLLIARARWPQTRALLVTLVR